MADDAAYEELVDNVVRPLLTEPDALEIEAGRNKNAVALNLKVAEADTGRVIGRGGATIRAIRATMEFLGEKRGDRVSVEITND